MAAIPDRIYIDIRDWDVINQLERENYFNFSNKTRKDQFMFALAIGVNSDLNINSVNIEKRREIFLTKDLSENDKAIFYAVAIKSSNGDLNIINDLNEVYKIVQKYAHIGFQILYNRIKNTAYGSFEKIFEVEMAELYNELFLIKN